MKKSSRLLVNSLKPLYPLLQELYVSGDADGCCGVLRKWMVSVPDDCLYTSKEERQFLADVVRLTASSTTPSVKRGTIQVASNLAGRLGEWQLALSVASRGKREGVETSGQSIARLINPHNWNHILRWCYQHQVPLCMPTALTVMGTTNDWASALALAQEGERRLPMSSDAYAASVLVPYLANGGHWSEAMRTFGTALASGAAMANPLASRMLMATANPEAWQTSLALLHRMSKAHILHDIPTGDKETIFTAVAQVTPNWESSINVLREAIDHYVVPTEELVGAVISRCEHDGAWEAAMQVYTDVMGTGEVANETTHTQTYTRMVRSYRSAFHWDRALAAFSWMAHAGSSSNAAGLATLVDLCTDAEQWNVALKLGSELFEAVETEGHHGSISAATYNSMISACAQGALWNKAIELFNKQVADVAIAPHPLSVATTLMACVNAKKWSSALQFFSHVKSIEPVVVVPQTAYTLAIKSCAQAHRWNEAILLLSELHQNGLPFDGNERRLGLWAAALSGSWQLGLEHMKHIPVRNRSRADQLVIRQAAKKAGPAAQANVARALKHANKQLPRR